MLLLTTIFCDYHEEFFHLLRTLWCVIFTVIYTYFLGDLLLISEVLLRLEFSVYCSSRFRPSIEPLQLGG